MTAKELLLTYLENIGNADKLIDLFAEDGAIELPYLESVNMPWRWEGKQVLHGFFKNLPQSFPGFSFKNIKIHIDTPSQVFAEYEVDVIAAKTGRPYHQNYMGKLVAENGKIKLIREAMNMAAVAKSLYPNGIQDLNTK
ncbi:nuclear transport factor 2 family protein [Mucilaginibacter sp. UR6-1]|uniref:nuclear transport factor 2 family protein n=1 Tax=Mucilaginibacter sp. UR6-1 TaxID=1435643 RepID=UPI001E478D08|nr:nuclear transport factor 2 family protein [Mucilaginibacter sp. UR6-1]MCC8411188.1 nuclear transport factor 2 family protein [Mucilaginibacter sp. UR6-1]